MHRLNALTFRQLRALRAVTEMRSISRAAERLNLTPPAVHSQLKSLEENFGCMMLLREGPHAFEATPQGAALLEAFDKAEAGLQMAIHRIESLQKGLAGTVVLGVVSTAKYFAPRLVAALKGELPEVEIILKVGNRDAIVSSLGDRALDLAIMGRPPRDPPVTAVPIGDNPHVLIARPDHPLVLAPSVDPEAILREPFLAREPGSGTRILAQRYLDSLADGATIDLVEMDSNETIKQSVIAGLGIALISQHTVLEELASGRLATISAPGLPIIRKWYLLRCTDDRPTSTTQTVHDFIQARIGSILSPAN